ncbi:hypothetical protein Q0N35_16535 [Priestia koreensis]
MKHIRKFFQQHPKLTSAMNLIVTLLGIFIFPFLFMKNVQGFVLGGLIALLIINMVGVQWRSARPVKSHTE